MKQIHIIGAGGVGSWLAPALCLLIKNPKKVTLIDGDTLERKNLNRQLFTKDQIGQNKAVALAKKYGCDAYDTYYSHSMLELDESDWLLCCVDNNPGRRAVLSSCDQFGCRAIFGANETTSAEAYYYEPTFKGSVNDPRVYYHEMVEDDANDPRSEAIGCVEASQLGNIQLVSANFIAAALMQHLFVLWCMERPKIDCEAIIHFPYRIRQNLTSYEVSKLKDNHQCATNHHSN